MPRNRPVILPGRRPHAPAPRRPLALALMVALTSPAGPAWAQSTEGTSAARTLDTVVVQAQRDASTEGSRTYGGRETTLFKGIRSIRETPQPVTVISRQLLDDRVLPDLHEVLQNTPGVTVDYTDSERVNYFARGFAIDSLQIDGLSIDQAGSVFIQPDTVVLDRLEILRGAAGLLRGAGNPSATVNLVRKRPTRELQASAGLTLGSWDRRRVEADLSAPLNASGSVRGRIVAAYDDKDFFQDARTEQRRTVYGVLEADVTDSTLLTLSLQHADLYATGSWGGLPSDLDGSPLHLPRSTYLGADWNTWDRYNQQVFLGLEHRFDNDWNVRLNAAHTRFGYINDFKQTSFSRPASATDPHLVDVSTAIYGDAGSHQNAIGLVVDGPFQLFGRMHHLTAGAEGRNVKTANSSGYWNIAPMTGVDVREWNPWTSYPEPFDTGTANYFEGIDNATRQEGVFAVAKLSLADPLTALVGARANWWTYSVPSNPASGYSVDREITPYAGLVYDFGGRFSAYASYSEIFVPQSAYGRDGNLIAPITGEDYEAGIKGEFFRGRLNAALSLFRINNVGRAVDDVTSPDPCLPHYPTGYCRIADGKTRSQGWELELAGDLTPDWQIMAGYTNTRTENLRDNSPANVGQPVRSADPRHLLRVFTTYRLPGALQALRVGGGVQAQSDTYVRSGGLVARQGGYAVYNLMGSYQLNDAVRLQLNVNNLFDKSYYRKIAPTGFGTYYADPRNVMLTVHTRF
ncbi:TonB-dependent siderophore receptor [Luteimonas abyssi]|uniref:TonB-dependent siderophore receptor n=1 Tax=Luteimonas abyssi TaxID=1247514 RepID=UPI000737B4AC|nr:TonB-dependent siderophore receptor [Luteimonas abyssi]